jgi:hypothetical protein
MTDGFGTIYKKGKACGTCSMIIIQTILIIKISQSDYICIRNTINMQ